MNLYINSPAYYTYNYGVIDEIYSMCNTISKEIDISKYTNVIDSIGITPIIAPEAEKIDDKWKDYKKVSIKNRIASISLSINYHDFCSSDIICQKQLILKNIFQSLLIIKSKLKNDFDYNKMESDILEIVEMYGCLS